MDSRRDFLSSAAAFAAGTVIGIPKVAKSAEFLDGSVTNLPQRVIDSHSNGVAPGNSANINATNLQALIDANTTLGATIMFAEPVPMDPFTLKSNIFLQGNNRAAFKGPTPFGGGAPRLTQKPAGAAFLVTNTVSPLCGMQTNTGVDGFVIHYPNQNFSATTIARTTTYPAAFKLVAGGVQSISLSRLCFVGATACMDLRTADRSTNFNADISVDLCYGFPLGGYFLAIGNSTDVARLTRCHVNPNAGWKFLGDHGEGQPWPYKLALAGRNGDVAVNGGDCYYITTTDDFMMSQCFAFDVNTAFHINDSYGRMSDCSADTVVVGVHVTDGGSGFKFLDVTNFVGVPSAASGGLPASRRKSILFDGNGTTTLTVSAMHSYTNVDSEASIEVAGTGAKQVDVSQCTQTLYERSGSWVTTVNQINRSAVVTGSVKTV